MTHEFPADVVRITDKFATELEQFNGLNVDDIAQLWKAYATQSTVVRNGVVSRLENLFWRIWGNVALQQSLTGVTLATLFMTIHENSSLAIAHRQQQSVSEAAEPPTVTNTTIETPMTITTFSPKSDEEQKETSPKKEPTKSPLPPILKKSGEGKKSQPLTAPSSYKTTRILIPEKPSQRTVKDATKDTTTESERSTKSTTTPNTATATQKPNRKKTAFVANRATSSRRRGVVIKRKSAQTSPIISPAAEHSEESLQEQILQETIAQKDAPRDQQGQQLEGVGAEKGPLSTELSWRSLSYLKIDKSKTSTVEQEASRSGTSPPPINFSLSSVRHHRSPENNYRVVYQETDSHAAPNQPLVDQGFRTQFVQRQSTQGTTNNSTASSLTTGLSSTNFRELLNAAEAAAAAIKNTTTNNDPNDCQSLAGSLPAGPRYVLPKPDATTVNSPTRTSDRRPMIINAQHKVDTEPVSRHSPAAVALSTSQHTTSGVFSVPRDSQGQLGEHLSSLIKAKTRRGQ